MRITARVRRLMIKRRWLILPIEQENVEGYKKCAHLAVKTMKRKI